MKSFIVEGKSENNMFTFEQYIKAPSLSEAQDKLFDWLKKQPVYPHMWRLQFEFREVGAIE